MSVRIQSGTRRALACAALAMALCLPACAQADVGERIAYSEEIAQGWIVVDMWEPASPETVQTVRVQPVAVDEAQLRAALGDDAPGDIVCAGGPGGVTHSCIAEGEDEQLMALLRGCRPYQMEETAQSGAALARAQAIAGALGIPCQAHFVGRRLDVYKHGGQQLEYDRYKNNVERADDATAVLLRYPAGGVTLGAFDDLAGPARGGSGGGYIAALVRDDGTLAALRIVNPASAQEPTGEAACIGWQAALDAVKAQIRIDAAAYEHRAAMWRVRRMDLAQAVSGDGAAYPVWNVTVEYQGWRGAAQDAQEAVQETTVYQVDALSGEIGARLSRIVEN